MAVRRTRKPAASKTGTPMVAMGDGTDAPNVAAVLAEKKKWAEVEAFLASKFDLSAPQVFTLYMKQEPILDPSLKFKATPASVTKARSEGLRWERIAIRTGTSEAVVRKMYEEATAKASVSSYAGKGRKFPPMVEGGLPVNYKQTHEYDEDSKTWVPKGNAANGSGPAKPRRVTRKSKAPAAKPARSARRTAKSPAAAE